MAEVQRKRSEQVMVNLKKEEAQLKRDKLESSLARQFILKAPELVSMNKLIETDKGFKKENSDYYQATII